MGGNSLFLFVKEIKTYPLHFYSPHVHLVLWTGKPVAELLAMTDLVVAQNPHARDDPHLHQLVTSLQIHHCGNYCLNPETQKCRFGYPFAPQNESIIDDLTNRPIYKRSEIDSYVNPYCPYLLKLLEVSMDIQINSTGRVLHYLAKYMSKVDTTVELQYGMENVETHFSARQIGAVDAVYFLAGWSKHCSSRGTVFISVTFPGMDERRQLRKNLKDIPEDSEDIFTHTHVDKYLNRHRQTAAISMTEYFTLYLIIQEQDNEDKFEQPTDSDNYLGNLNRNTINRQENERWDNRIGPLVNDRPSGLSCPTACTDNYGIRYRARLRNRLPLWRTHTYDQTAGEPFFYQLILLHYPIRNRQELQDLYMEHTTYRNIFFCYW